MSAFFIKFKFQGLTPNREWVAEERKRSEKPDVAELVAVGDFPEERPLLAAIAVVGDDCGGDDE
jgi:hypothetical protein